VTDLRDESRTLKITRPKTKDGHTVYNLVTDTGAHNIEVFVLKDFLKEKLGVEFSHTPE
jgi:hypothetical protein